MKSYKIRTFGCQMNYADSARLAETLDNLGFQKAEDDAAADVVIFNTCSVRQRSEDKAVGCMRQEKMDHKKTKIGVTGCMVRQTGDRTNSKDKLFKLKPVDFVFRIEDLPKLDQVLSQVFEEAPKKVSSVPAEGCGEYLKIIPKFHQKFQVLVPIMTGCNKFCTYCIVPYARGREVSRSMQEIFDECQQHVRNGAKEITLLGQNVNSYTSDGRKCFADLLRKVDTLHSSGLSRVRWTSAHPQDFTDDVIEAVATLPTQCAYVHLPAQHGSDQTLHAMNRNYTAEQFELIVQKLRARIPDVSISTDLIVGFPGETEEDFQKLCDFARQMKFDFSYTAIFSPRTGTPAAKMKKDFVPVVEKRRRFHELDLVIKEGSWAKRDARIGKVLNVLVERSEKQPDGTFVHGGRSREFFEVFFRSGRSLVGQEVDVRILSRDGFVLNGELV